MQPEGTLNLSHASRLGNALLRVLKLPISVDLERVVLMALIAYCDAHRVCPTVQQLVASTDSPDRSVRRTVASLTERGWVVKQRCGMSVCLSISESLAETIAYRMPAANGEGEAQEHARADASASGQRSEATTPEPSAMGGQTYTDATPEPSAMGGQTYTDATPEPSAMGGQTYTDANNAALRPSATHGRTYTDATPEPSATHGRRYDGTVVADLRSEKERDLDQVADCVAAPGLRPSDATPPGVSEHQPDQAAAADASTQLALFVLPPTTAAESGPVALTREAVQLPDPAPRKSRKKHQAAASHDGDDDVGSEKGRSKAPKELVQWAFHRFRETYSRYLHKEYATTKSDWPTLANLVAHASQTVKHRFRGEDDARLEHETKVVLAHWFSRHCDSSNRWLVENGHPMRAVITGIPAYGYPPAWKPRRATSTDESRAASGHGAATKPAAKAEDSRSQTPEERRHEYMLVMRKNLEEDPKGMLSSLLWRDVALNVIEYFSLKLEDYEPVDETKARPEEGSP